MKNKNSKKLKETPKENKTNSKNNKRVSKKQLKSQSFLNDSQTIYAIINTSEQNKKRLEVKREKQLLFMKTLSDVKHNEDTKVHLDDCIAGISNI
jgi:hypothetical protein